MKSEDRMWKVHLALIEALSEDPRLDSDYSRLRLRKMAEDMRLHGESDSCYDPEQELTGYYDEVLNRARGITGWCVSPKEKVKTDKS